MDQANNKNNKVSGAAPNASNEELMKQVVDLQRQMLEQQKTSLAGVNEKRVNKYAVFLFVFAGIFLLWFFGSIVSLSYSYSYRSAEFLVHDHLIMPVMAVVLIAAGVMLMTKKRMANTWVGVAMGTGALWNIVAVIHGFTVESTRYSGYGYSAGNASTAMTLAIVRLLIGLLVVGGMTLWFYKSKSIQDTIKSW